MEAQELKHELDGIRDALDERVEGRFKELDAAITEIVQRQSGFHGMPGGDRQSAGKQFIDSPQFKSLTGGDAKSARLEIKNTISNLTGSPAEVGSIIAQPDRLSGVVPGAFRSLNVLDVLPIGSTSSSVVEYTREDSWSSSAAETQEEAEKPESDLEFELVVENVRTIAHFVKMSNQAMDDSAMVESYVNNRLLHGARQRLQTQILKGNGTSPNLDGLDQSGRHTAFTPTTGDTALQSLNRAKYEALSSDYQVNTIILNPTDWGSIERDTDNEGKYVAGEGAAISYVASGMIPTVWGCMVVLSNDVASGKFYALDRNAVEVFIRQGAVVEAGFVGDDFKKNLLTLRCELRAALAVFAPLAVRHGDLVV